MDDNTNTYNAQAGVIVACDTTRQENDKGQLAPMIQRDAIIWASPRRTPLRWPIPATVREPIYRSPLKNK
jgi:hypothetical protein